MGLSSEAFEPVIITPTSRGRIANAGAVVRLNNGDGDGVFKPATIAEDADVFQVLRIAGQAFPNQDLIIGPLLVTEGDDLRADPETPQLYVRQRKPFDA